jgi:hypothetical protein
MVATVWPFLTSVSLFYIEVGDAAHGGGAQIRVGLGLDLAGAADHRGQLLAHDLGGKNLGVAGLLPVNEEGYKSSDGHCGENNQKYLFHAGTCSGNAQFQCTQSAPVQFPAACQPARRNRINEHPEHGPARRNVCVASASK